MRAQPELRLWPGKAPGSEQWSIPESITRSPSGDRVITNVSDPTLTVFLPDAGDSDGRGSRHRARRRASRARVRQRRRQARRVAQRARHRGLRAQVPHAAAGSVGAARPVARHAGARRGAQELVIVNANANPAPDDAALGEVLELAVADAQAALALVRSRAREWRIDPERVGIIGFSAGGGVAVGTALAAKSDASPDFLVSVYGPSLQDVNVPAHAPPLFVAVGATHFNVTNGCLALFAAWKAAGKPAEIHVYDGISAGFGMTKRGHPVDGWTDRLHEWLVARELTRQVDPDR